MEILYSNILPLAVKEGQSTFQDVFYKQVSKADSLEITVGYVSKASLDEIENIVSQNNIKHITLTIGMYYIEGMPEALYHKAVSLNEKWTKNNIGEVRLTKVFKNHSKVFAFYKNGVPFSAILGSANLGAIKLEASNLRQYELSALTEDPIECEQLASFIREISSPKCSENISTLNIKIEREENTALTGIDTVERIPQIQVKLLKKHRTNTSFVLPIKVPSFEDRYKDDKKHYTQSNLNTSYSKPRSAKKPRDWYETQFHVSKAIRSLDGYPKKNVPFYVVTDDGFMFKCHTTSSDNKQFSAVGDELIFGRWIKGRIAAAGLVEPVNDTQADKERTGMITKEMLTAYGCSSLTLTKTDQHQEDEDGSVLDVWLLLFENSENNEEDS